MKVPNFRVDLERGKRMIKVFEAFSGIGTQRMALRNLGIEHEVAESMY